MLTKTFLLIVVLLGFANSLVASQHNPKGKRVKKPNVVFIAVDDLNDWLGCMKGHPNAKTPNLDQLAAEGVLFLNAHCQSPLCGPSRASLMSGLRPSTSGIYGMIEDDQIRSENPVTKDIVFLPEYFKNHGYTTMGIGKLFHTHAPKGIFDESGGRFPGFGPLPEKRFVWDGIGTADLKKHGKTATDWGAFPAADSLMPDFNSANWAIERLSQEYDQPFFLAVGFLRPHVPFYVPQKWFDMHPVDEIKLPNYKEDDLDDIPEIARIMNDLPMMPSTRWAIESGEWVNIVRAYLACVSFVDHQIGRVLNALKNSEHANNTVVVLWSDHGYRFGEKGTFAKHTLWEEATNAPLIFAGVSIPKGKVINTPAEMLSVYPTLLELCSLPPYNRNEGKSLVPVMMGKSTGKKNVAVTTFGMNNHSIRSEQYRYTHYEDGGEELYDHFSDLNEWYNLSENMKLKKLKSDMQKHLPKLNAPWAKYSSYTLHPYFVEQKAISDKLLKDQILLKE